MEDPQPGEVVRVIQEKKPGESGKSETFFKVQFNPETLKVSFSNQIVPPATSGSASDQRGTSTTQFVGKGTTKLSVQLYSLRDQTKDGNHLAVLQALAKAGFAGVELAGFYGLQPRELRRIVEDLGMAVSSNHCFPCPTPENVQHIAYVGNDQLIHELFYLIG